MIELILMRVFVLFILVLGAVGFNFGVVSTQSFSSVVSRAKERIVGFSYDKKVFFAGLKVLDQAQLQKTIPFEKSVFWWYLNGAQLEGALRKHALIEKSEVNSCKPFVWGCFEITLQEIEPKYTALVGSRVFVAGTAGKFEEVRAESTNLSAFFAGKEPIILSGIDDKSVSPDVLGARLEYLKHAVALISDRCNCEVSRANILGNGELGVFVRDIGTEFRFDPPLEGGVEQTMANIGRKATRMAQILKKLRFNNTSLGQVDLSFDRVAVLKPAKVEK